MRSGKVSLGFSGFVRSGGVSLGFSDFVRSGGVSEFQWLCVVRQGKFGV